MRARSEVSQCFQYGLLIFILTVLIGMAHATKIFGTLDENTLVTHLHSGTLGWITLGVIALSVWLFGGGSAVLGRMVMASAVITALYILAFWSGNAWVRAVLGAAELAVISGWWWWTVSRAGSAGIRRIDVPQLSFVLGLTTLVIGSIVGVIIEVLVVLGRGAQTTDLIGAHASAQVGGYLVLVAAAVVEWQLHGGGTRTTAGVLQAALLFLAGLLLAAGSMLNVLPLLLLSNLLQTVAIVMIVVRLGRVALAVRWGAATGKRHIAIVVPYLVLSLVLNILLVQAIGQAHGDISRVSLGLLHALDHTMFVGVMTNVLFGSILMYAADRPRVWPWADHLIFWGLNIGAISFIGVLLFVGTSEGTKAFAHPVAYTASLMGLAALLGIVTLFLRLRLPNSERAITQV